MSSPTLDAIRSEGGLSLTALSRIERRFSEALRHLPNARVNLRLAVRHLVGELEAQDVPRSVARRVVQYIAEHHPDRHDLDRTSMVTGERESDRVMRQMLSWVDEVRAA